MNVQINSKGDPVSITSGEMVKGVEYLEGKERDEYLRKNQIGVLIGGGDAGVICQSCHAPTAEEINNIQGTVIQFGQFAGLKRGEVYTDSLTDLVFVDGFLESREAS